MEFYLEKTLKAVNNKNLVLLEASKGVKPIMIEDHDEDEHEEHHEEESEELHNHEGHHHHHGDIDPHAWLSLQASRIMVKNIETTLSKLDKKNAKEIKGAEEGGFVNTERKQDGKKFTARLSPDKRGFIDAPTVLVGENGGEYVIPNDGMRNPTLLPFINTIETARRTGKLRNLNFEAVYPISSIVSDVRVKNTSPLFTPYLTNSSLLASTNPFKSSKYILFFL